MLTSWKLERATLLICSISTHRGRLFRKQPVSCRLTAPALGQQGGQQGSLGAGWAGVECGSLGAGGAGVECGSRRARGAGGKVTHGLQLEAWAVCVGAHLHVHGAYGGRMGAGWSQHHHQPQRVGAFG
jgi:hypothetical protein